MKEYNQTIRAKKGVKGETEAGDDIEEVKWFDLNNLPDLPFDHADIIADYLKTK